MAGIYVHKHRQNNDSIIERVFAMRRELSNIPIIDRFIDF